LRAGFRETRSDENLYRHSREGVGRLSETARHGHCLANVAHDGDRDQIEAADAAVGRIECDPARAGT
jgi:hypothetical protein